MVGWVRALNTGGEDLKCITVDKGFKELLTNERPISIEAHIINILKTIRLIGVRGEFVCPHFNTTFFEKGALELFNDGHKINMMAVKRVMRRMLRNHTHP